MEKLLQAYTGPNVAASYWPAPIYAVCASADELGQRTTLVPRGHREGISLHHAPSEAPVCLITDGGQILPVGGPACGHNNLPTLSDINPVKLQAFWELAHRRNEEFFPHRKNLL